MYFGGGESFWGKAPILIANSTTSILAKNILDWTYDETQTARLTNKITSIESAIRNREEKAITISLFKQYIQLNKEEEILLARLISTFYTQRYLEYLNGTIMTGVRRLDNYDLSKDNFPYYDYPIYSSLLDSLLFTGINFNEASIESLVVSISNMKFDPYYSVFLEECKDLINAIKSTVCPSKSSIDICRGHIQTFFYSKIRSLLSRYENANNIQEAIGYLIYIKHSLAKDYPLITQKTISRHMKKVLLVVATMTELEETLKFFNSYGKPRRFSLGSHTYWSLGVIREAEVFIFKTAMGSKGQSGSILSINDAIISINPDYIIQVGICFGLKPDKQMLTQVIVTNVLQDYEPARNSKDKVTPRGERIPSDATLIDRFEAGAIEWGKSKVHFGLVLTGEKLSDSEEFVHHLREQFPDAIGGEMEGGGLLASAHREKKGWILVKGICDWGFNKEDGYQQQASLNAIDLVYFILNNSDL